MQVSGDCDGYFSDAAVQGRNSAMPPEKARIVGFVQQTTPGSTGISPESPYLALS